MSDVYQTPDADLIEKVNPGEYGSVERALQGNYNLNIKEIFAEAWNKTSGTKLTIFLCFLILGLVSTVLSLLTTAISPSVGVGAILVSIVLNLLTTLITGPLGAGLFMIGVKCAVNKPISVNEIGKYWHKILPIFGVYVLMYLLIILGFIALIIPGIYLSVAYMMALPLVVEKNMGVWEALETSRKAITKKWWVMLGVVIVSFVVAIIGMLPLFIGLIWAMPVILIAYGIVYRNMFGVEGDV